MLKTNLNLALKSNTILAGIVFIFGPSGRLVYPHKIFLLSIPYC